MTQDQFTSRVIDAVEGVFDPAFRVVVIVVPIAEVAGGLVIQGRGTVVGQELPEPAIKAVLRDALLNQASPAREVYPSGPS